LYRRAHRAVQHQDALGQRGFQGFYAFGIVHVIQPLSKSAHCPDRQALARVPAAGKS
jgi:hypothetical protein